MNRTDLIGLRRSLLKYFGGVVGCSFLPNMPLIAGAEPITQAPNSRKQRLVIVFSPNGTVPDEFWPDQTGADFQFKKILQPLEGFRDQTLIVKGLCNEIQGDGDGHMRGMAGLLTGIELLPGYIQGGGT